MKEHILEKLIERFPDALITYKDSSEAHAKHGASGKHIHLELVSNKFEGKKIREMHQMVYEVLAEELQGAIHALQLTTKPYDKEIDYKELYTNRLGLADCVVFIKGNREIPMCGYSGGIINILRKEKIECIFVDITWNNEFKETIKALSRWPTFPQVYSKQVLLGGYDVVKQLVDMGKLHEELE